MPPTSWQPRTLAENCKDQAANGFSNFQNLRAIYFREMLVYRKTDCLLFSFSNQGLVWRVFGEQCFIRVDAGVVTCDKAASMDSKRRRAGNLWELLVPGGLGYEYLQYCMLRTS